MVTAIRAGQVLTGPLFSEPMRVVTVRTNAHGVRRGKQPLEILKPAPQYNNR